MSARCRGPTGRRPVRTSRGPTICGRCTSSGRCEAGRPGLRPGPRPRGSAPRNPAKGTALGTLHLVAAGVGPTRTLQGSGRPHSRRNQTDACKGSTFFGGSRGEAGGFGGPVPAGAGDAAAYAGGAVVGMPRAGIRNTRRVMSLNRATRLPPYTMMANCTSRHSGWLGQDAEVTADIDEDGSDRPAADLGGDFCLGGQASEQGLGFLLGRGWGRPDGTRLVLGGGAGRARWSVRTGGAPDQPFLRAHGRGAGRGRCVRGSAGCRWCRRRWWWGRGQC